MHTIKCPSGLEFQARRKWTLGDRKILMDRAVVRSGKLLHKMLSVVVGHLTDPGPYSFPNDTIDWEQVSNADITSAVIQVRRITRPVFSFDSLCEFCKATMALSVDLSDMEIHQAHQHGLDHLRTGEPITRVYQGLTEEDGEPIGPKVRMKLKLLRGSDHVTLMGMQKNETDGGMVEVQNCMQIVEMQVGDGDVWTWEFDSDKIRTFYAESEWDFDEALDTEILKLGGGVETELPIVCKECQGEQTQLLPFNTDFFIPRKKRRAFSMTVE